MSEINTLLTSRLDQTRLHFDEHKIGWPLSVRDLIWTNGALLNCLQIDHIGSLLLRYSFFSPKQLDVKETTEKHLRLPLLNILFRFVSIFKFFNSEVDNLFVYAGHIQTQQGRSGPP